jgi:hypothetical protein
MECVFIGGNPPPTEQSAAKVLIEIIAPYFTGQKRLNAELLYKAVARKSKYSLQTCRRCVDDFQAEIFKMKYLACL